jgi:hypothetical protein
MLLLPMMMMLLLLLLLVMMMMIVMIVVVDDDDEPRREHRHPQGRFRQPQYRCVMAGPANAGRRTPLARAHHARAYVAR